ncbi:MAG: hypothetical protein AB7F19_07220 [Candidatus Babeliales bacterium]
MKLLKILIVVGVCMLYGYSMQCMFAHNEDLCISECSYVYEPLAEYQEIGDYCDFGYEYQPAYRTRTGQVYYQFPHYNGGGADFGCEYDTYNYGRGSEYYQDCW